MATTSAISYILPRSTGGVWTQTEVQTSSNAVGNLLPSSLQPIGYVMVNGQRLPVQIDTLAWHPFLRAVADYLGNLQGPRLPDVVSSVETTQAQAVQASAQVSAVAQQSQANAEALAATVQVAQNAGLAGASQIPPVVLTNYEVVA